MQYEKLLHPVFQPGLFHSISMFPVLLLPGILQNLPNEYLP